jgi:RNA polymerase sigma-70 factor (ECF subfamily)
MEVVTMEEAGREHTPEGDRLVRAAAGGDEAAFAVLAERHRRELHVHCYRMLGSLTEAEDLVQETLLRAWRRRESFEGRSTYRAWLYRIATNACLDFLDHSSRRVNRLPSQAELAGQSPAEVPWLQPYPDRLLNQIAPSDAEPDAVVVAKETIELAYLLAIQLLSPPQRAVLILRDILEWSARETAEALGTTVASVNSSLQRAKASLQAQRPSAGALPALSTPTEAERALLEQYMEAHARADASAVVALLGEEVRFTMPPQPTHYEGRLALTSLFNDAFGAEGPGEFRLVPTMANRQLAAANYVRAPGDTVFRAMSLDVLRMEDGVIVEITTFEPHLFGAFGLPPSL